MNSISPPETREIEQQTSDALTQAGEIEIRDEAGYKAAGAFVQVVKDLLKKVDDTFAESIEAAHKTHKKILAAKKAHAEPLEEAEKIVKWKIGKYFDDQQRKIREENARAAAELYRQQEEHRLAVAKHEAEVKAQAVAQAKIEAAAARARLLAAEKNRPLPPVPPPAPVLPPPPPPPVVMAAPVTIAPSASGVSMRTDWKHEVYGLMELVKAVAAGTASSTFLLPNDAALKAEAVRIKSTSTIPGVRFYSETVPVVR